MVWGGGGGGPGPAGGGGGGLLGLGSRRIRKRFVLDEVAMGQVFLPVLRVSLVSIITPLLYSFWYHC